MYICLVLFGVIYSVQSEDFGYNNAAEIERTNEEIINDDILIPSGLVTSKMILKFYKMKPLDNMQMDYHHLEQFLYHVDKGHTAKSLIFNLYDDNIREATLSLFRLICSASNKSSFEHYKSLREWLRKQINGHMLDYVERLCNLYGAHTYEFKHKSNEPPFLFKPNFYVNGETIYKALKLKNDGLEDFQESEANVITINTNYSNWNLPLTDCGEKIDYFTEDIGLNSYHYGLHLLHPFWMSNNELDEINPRHAEHYYFSYKQLWTRYQLELESARQRNVKRDKNCDDPFVPNLIYDNGLPFPTRSNIRGERYEVRAKVAAIDIGIKEFISRGFIIMDDGTKHINFTEDNYINLLSKIIRANYDGIKTSKLIRNLYGYGRNGFPENRYNPAPSLIHQPETSLRDPVYWNFIEYLLKYFRDFAETLPPFDISIHESQDYEIVAMRTPKISSFFTYYTFEIDKTCDKYNASSIIYLAARQRRLSAMPWAVHFSIKSNITANLLAKLFLGPPCDQDKCWKEYYKYFLIDTFPIEINKGLNNIQWTPESSNILTTDEFYSYNREHSFQNTSFDDYNIFKFPMKLLLPKGSEEGVNMTLFIIVTPIDNNSSTPLAQDGSYYNTVTFEYDSKPLDFPFHRPSVNFKLQATNYKFHNITIYHKKITLSDGSGYFSPHLN